MLDEQIKKEVELQIKNQKNNPIDSIILNSQYHCICFAGQADLIAPVNILARFNQDIFQNKYSIIT